MRMGYDLRLEQSQKLIMTPELRQAITILQFSALELSSFVDEQLQENPLLEVVDGNAANANDAKEKETDPVKSEEPTEPENNWDMDWEEYFQRQEDRVTREYEPDDPDKKRFEPFVAAAPTLQEHLLEQLHVQKISIPVEQVEYIIGNLDDNGYLEIPLEEIARDEGISESSAQKALSVVQMLDPLGVGARSLEECLRLQLPLIPDAPSQMPEFLKHLEDLAAGRLQRIATKMKITIAEVQTLADWVRKLDPKPGRRFSGMSDVRYIVPDVMVEDIDGEFIILVNDITVPRLGINQAYRSALSQDKENDTRKFVEQKLNAAAWLIRSIEQRRTTLYKVANALVNRQEDFLRKGIRYLHPLTLKDIADEIGVHESTVSRATANKYIQTPRGIYEFKFFFASGIKNEPGVTTEGIKQALKDLIAGENPKAPYSDQKLSELLKAKEMEISRRTVAKYRDELGIPSTALRKRY